MRYRFLAGLIVAGLMTSGCLAAGAEDVDASDANATPADAPARFTMESAACTELIVLTAIPAAVAREFVPDRFTIATESSGLAPAFAGLKVCEDLMVDRVSVGTATTSDVGVMIEAPDGSEGIHYYQSWWGTDNAALHAALDAQGWRAFLSPGSGIADGRLAGAAGPVDAAVPWADGDYAVSAAVTSTPVPGELVGTGWFETASGQTLTAAKVLTSSVQGHGAGTISAAAGSPMAALFDGTERPGAGLFNVYTMKGTVGPAAS